MFRLEGFCEDKNVVNILKSLTGVVMDFKIVPVANAKVQNGKVAAKTDGDSISILLDFIKKHQLKEITSAQGQELMREIGNKPGSYSNFFQRAIRAKVLKQSGKGVYTVLSTGGK